MLHVVQLARLAKRQNEGKHNYELNVEKWDNDRSLLLELFDLFKKY